MTTDTAPPPTTIIAWPWPKDKTLPATLTRTWAATWQAEATQSGNVALLIIRRSGTLYTLDNYKQIIAELRSDSLHVYTSNADAGQDAAACVYYPAGGGAPQRRLVRDRRIVIDAQQLMTRWGVLDMSDITAEEFAHEAWTQLAHPAAIPAEVIDEALEAGAPSRGPDGTPAGGNAAAAAA
jgi:hypothetical protein